MSRLEWLLSLCSPRSIMPMAPGHVQGTAPALIIGHEAIAELSYAAHGPKRMQVLAALLRWAPEVVSAKDYGELLVWLRDHLIIYALTQRPRLTDRKLPKAVKRACYCAMAEHADYSPCPMCKGKRHVLMATDGTLGVTKTRCPGCRGSGSLGWTDTRRAQTMQIPRRTAEHCRLELARAGAGLLAQWEAEGMDVIEHKRMVDVSAA